MGSPISLILTDIFIKQFEQQATATADLCPTVWLRYVYETFVIWSQGRDNVVAFLEHLNGLWTTIQFTIDQERDDTIPFLDAEGSRQADGTLSNSVYHKPSYTD